MPQALSTARQEQVKVPRTGLPPTAWPWQDLPELPKPEMHIVDMSKAEVHLGCFRVVKQQVDFAIEVAKKGDTTP